MSKLTGDPKIDFPEMYYNDIDNVDESSNIEIIDVEIIKQNEYLKRAIINEVVENVSIREDNSIYDKRLKKSIFKKLFDSLFF